MSFLSQLSMNYTWRFVDIHTHINLSAFADDRVEVAERALGAGVAHINVGVDAATSRLAVELADERDGVYAAVGLHPVEAAGGESDGAQVLRELAADTKVVAIGECGLDYYRATEETEAKQREVFRAQIALANELKKPLMLHIRNGQDSNKNAYVDACEILAAEAKVPGNAHFFAGSVDDARGFFELGYTVSFTGVITFARDYDEVIRYAPADMIHVETDAPYVTPSPHRGKRNEPAYVPLVAAKLAEIRGEDEAVLAAQLRANAKRVFGI